MTEQPLVAVALFSLKEGRTVEGYRELSREVIRPGMAKMPSVTGFMDYDVAGSMSESTEGWELAEVVQITSAEEFERDNTQMPGKAVADVWNEWVDKSLVLYLREL